MVDEPTPWIAVRSGQISAEIDPRGAQLSVLRDGAGRDWLWDGNPAVWAGRAPLLFPIVGTLAGGVYRLGQKEYAMSRHGFARGMVFKVQRADASSVVLRLAADPATLAMYPFLFDLTMHFFASGASLSVTARVRNAGDVDMPASIGYHPAFRWPLTEGMERAAYYLQFEHSEPAPVRRLDAAGLLSDVRHPSPVVGRRMGLNDALFQDDVLIFDALRSRSVWYGCGTGPRLRLDFPDARYVGVWTKPGARFICIEPWHGIADAVGFAGDLIHKPGIVVLAPGGEMTTTMVLTLDDSAAQETSQ